MSTTYATAEMPVAEVRRPTLLPFIVLVVGSMIGGGVFNRLSNMWLVPLLIAGFVEAGYA